MVGIASRTASAARREVYAQVIYIPLGQYRLVNAWRTSLTGMLEGPATPVFWNIDKKE